MTFSNEGINQFRVKVGQVAADDYVELHRILHRIDNGEKIKTYDGTPSGTTRKYYERKLEELMEYLYSDAFRLLCPIDVNKMLNILDKEVDEWKAEYNRKL